MHVEVIELRREGVKLTADQLRQAKPVIGRLMLQRSPHAWHASKARAPLVAMLIEDLPQVRTVLEPIDAARVVEIGQRGMLIVGMQEARRGRRYMTFAQAWWARPVGSALDR